VSVDRIGFLFEIFEMREARLEYDVVKSRTSARCYAREGPASLDIVTCSRRASVLNFFAACSGFLARSRHSLSCLLLLQFCILCSEY
jgi:hypothetical protein